MPLSLFFLVHLSTAQASGAAPLAWGTHHTAGCGIAWPRATEARLRGLDQTARALPLLEASTKLAARACMGMRRAQHTRKRAAPSRWPTRACSWQRPCTSCSGECTGSTPSAVARDATQVATHACSGVRFRIVPFRKVRVRACSPSGGCGGATGHASAHCRAGRRRLNTVHSGMASRRRRPHARARVPGAPATPS